MAELITYARSEVSYQAGTKAHPTELNRIRAAIIDSAAVFTAANGDTFATHLIIPAGSRIMAGVLLSCAAGTASTTLSIGLRDAITKVAIDATAILNAASIASAATLYLFTGTKVLSGLYYIVPQDAEIYGTFGGGTPLANQALRAEIQWVSP